MARRVLVTGATGFIGGRTVVALAEAGHEVIAMRMKGEAAPPRAARSVVADLRDPRSLAAAVEGVDVVVHLAAKVGDWGALEDFADVNVGGTRRLCRAATAARVSRLVLISSVVVYGDQMNHVRCSEEREPMGGVSPYSVTKLASEEVATGFGDRGDLEVVILRPGNVWGPGSALWVDTLLAELRSGLVPFIEDGRGDAFLTHVDNLASAIEAAIETPTAIGRIYNINDGSGVSWRRYVRDICSAARVVPPRFSLGRRTALVVARGLELAARARRQKKRPRLTREAVQLLAGGLAVPIDRASHELEWRPPRPYGETMDELASLLASTERSAR